MLKEKWSCIQLLSHSGCLIAGSGFDARGNLSIHIYCLNTWKYKGFANFIVCVFALYAVLGTCSVIDLHSASSTVAPTHSSFACFVNRLLVCLFVFKENHFLGPHQSVQLSSLKRNASHKE